MSEKKIEPTEAMVEAGASSAWEEVNPGILGWNSISERHKEGCRRDARAVLTAALNHPDAAGLFADEDTIRAAREEGWDQATRWIDSYQGGPNGRTTSARSANPYRPVQELPTKDGAVIVPAEGREFIEAEVAGQTFIAREAVVCESDFGPANVLEGAWRRVDDGSRVGGQVSRDFITPGTWQVADQ